MNPFRRQRPGQVRERLGGAVAGERCIVATYARSKGTNRLSLIILGFLLAVLFSLFLSSYLVEAQDMTWTRQFGTAGYDNAKGVAADSSGI